MKGGKQGTIPATITIIDSGEVKLCRKKKTHDSLTGEWWPVEISFNRQLTDDEMWQLVGYAHLVLKGAKPDPVRHGHWIYHRLRAECSECHHDYVDAHDMENADNFCRFCGARMD